MKTHLTFALSGVAPWRHAAEARAKQSPLPECYNFSMERKKYRLPRKKIAAFCQRWGINEFSVFGSVLRADFRPDSDINVLISLEPEAPSGPLEFARMQIELECLFKHPVDLIEKKLLRYPYRKWEILRTAQVIYSAE